MDQDWVAGREIKHVDMFSRSFSISILKIIRSSIYFFVKVEKIHEIWSKILKQNESLLFEIYNELLYHNKNKNLLLYENKYFV